ncbi:ABC transporter ATP-binding protein [Rhizobium puerariae]|uniref:Glutathione import ATP-binding protein GsiA n=1 Tax=Rhizobium puerariae TaxID=1585791 RepID=A0ABV6AIQ2_9HYPH
MNDMSRQASKQLLSVRNLNVSFRSSDPKGGTVWNRVVKDLSFDVASGKTLAVVGESGSGKSVTSLAITRLLDARKSCVSGEILFQGQSLTAMTDRRMRRLRGSDISMIFQEPMTSLNPVYTIGHQVSETLIEHRGLSAQAAEAETVRLFDRVRIPSARARLKDFPHNFSGGMRQRVLIAMALSCNPKLLIADEPTTALDVTIQAQIIELIKELQDETGMSVLFITHDMGVVAEVADETLVMFRGDAVENGPTGELFANPQKPYTKALLLAVPRLGSMSGIERPMRFPALDKATGEADTPRESPDTVDWENEPFLRVSNLVKRFEIRAGLLRKVTARVHAVENISFELRQGETLALVGESGCGKSTAGQSILRLQEPTAGNVVFEGIDLRSLAADRLRSMRTEIQMVFQDPYASLNPRIRVGDAIAEPIISHGLGDRAFAAARVAELLERVGLSPDMMSRFPHEFSGGQRQRISIARALAVKPKLLVADEAVSALDVSIKAQVVNLLLDLQERLKLAYLFISHDMAVVERISHRVAIMYLGEIVEIGPRAAIFRSPRHPYTRRLLSAVPIPEPSRRHMRRPTSSDEIKSPIRSADYIPPVRGYSEVGPGHFVQDFGSEWSTSF